MTRVANKKCKIVVMAGGTGGHVYPALTVANELMNRNVDVSWVGRGFGIEKTLVTQAKIKMIDINVRGYAGKGQLNKIVSIVLLMLNLTKLLFIFIKNRPSAVIGFGGYISLPGSIAAKILFIPVLLHEQNSRIGIANKIIAKFANKTLLAFDGAFNGDRILITGNPVRKEICDLNNVQKTYSDAVKLLIVGGSLGAEFFNKHIIDAISEDMHISVIHQCGNHDKEEIEKRYMDKGINATVVNYIDNIENIYKETDLVICRAGAMTVSELLCAAIPAIYIPFPYAIYNHQYHNAKFVEKIKGGYVIDENKNTVKSLNKLLRDILSNNHKKISEMRKNLISAKYHNGTDLIVSSCLEYC